MSNRSSQQPYYRIEFAKSACKEFQKLPNTIQKRIIKTLDILKTDPFNEILKIRKLRGRENLFRIRVGDYRIIYSVESSEMLFIFRIRHRKDVYENI